MPDQAPLSTSLLSSLSSSMPKIYIFYWRSSTIASSFQILYLSLLMISYLASNSSVSMSFLNISYLLISWCSRYKLMRLNTSSQYFLKGTVILSSLFDGPMEKVFDFEACRCSEIITSSKTLLISSLSWDSLNFSKSFSAIVITNGLACLASFRFWSLPSYDKSDKESLSRIGWWFVE